MKVTPAIKEANERICRYETLRRQRLKEIEELDGNAWYSLRNQLFAALTGEPSFDRFYDRFDAPGVPRGKPIAWGPRFWPDLINDLIWDETLAPSRKVKEILKLYRKCRKLEKKVT